MTDKVIGSEEPLGPKPDQEPLHDFLDRIDQRIGEVQRCPMCGGTEWATVTGNEAAIDLADMPSGRRPTLGAIRFALLYCERCRFIRTHLAAP